MYKVVLHQKVKSDFRKVSAEMQDRALRMIEEKLQNYPEKYGKPLRHTLKNLRSLRLGDYRIVYTIKKNILIVLVLTVGKRDRVYKEAERRI